MRNQEIGPVKTHSLFQDAEAGENSSAGLRGGAAEGAEHAAGEGGRLSERRVEAVEGHPQVGLVFLKSK